jgi:hypothetical protein
LEEVKRSAGYSLDLTNSEIAISDDRLDPGWYRIIGRDGSTIVDCHRRDKELYKVTKC